MICLTLVLIHISEESNLAQKSNNGDNRTVVLKQSNSNRLSGTNKLTNVLTGVNTRGAQQHGADEGNLS